MKLFHCQDFNTFCSKSKKYNRNKYNYEEGELFNEWSEFEREIKYFMEGTTIENIDGEKKIYY